MKEQFVPEGNRDVTSFNADDEFNRAIDEENIDFNIPGLPHSTVKRSHGVNVQNLIQKIESHPQRQALQSDLQQHRQFNPFSKESRDVIKAVGNIELCELLDVEPKAQCKVCLSYWDVGIVFYCTCGYFLRDDTTENKKYIKSVFDLFSIPNFYIWKGRPHGHRYGKKEGIKLITKIGGKALPHLGGIGKIIGDIPHLRHHRDDGPSTDGAGKLEKTVNGPIIRGMSLNINLVQKLQ